jgi:hypothetical protein
VSRYDDKDEYAELHAGIDRAQAYLNVFKRLEENGKSHSSSRPATREDARSQFVKAFQDAGFCEDDAQRGVRMLESGRYIDFADAALSLGVFESSGRSPHATSERIAEVARRLSGRSTAAEESMRQSTAESLRIINGD